MAETATQRIAAKLAARKAAPAQAAEAEAPETEPDEVEDEDDALLPAETKPATVSERAKAAREARQSKNKSAGSVGAAPPDLVPAKKAASPAQIAAREAFAARSKANAAAKANGTAAPTGPKAKPAVKASAGKGGTGPGKKGPSAAQLAARAAFAARSKANAAARAEAVEAEPVQTEQALKAKQSADRKADRTAKGITPPPPKAKAGKPVVVQKASKAAAARVVKADKAAAAKPTPLQAKAKTKPVAAKAPVKAAKAKPASAGSTARGDSKAQVLALIAKGMSRRDIAATTGLSYAAVYFHSRGVEGAGTGLKGSIIVDTPLNEDGVKFGRGKTEKVSRSEAMRRMYKSGVAVGDVARAFEVRYQIAYTAIRPLLGDAE